MEKIDKNNFGLLASRMGLVETKNGHYYLMNCNLSFYLSDEDIVTVEGIMPLELAKRILELERTSDTASISFVNELSKKIERPMRFPKKETLCGFSRMFNEEDCDETSLSEKYGIGYITGVNVFSLDVLGCIIRESREYYNEKSSIEKSKESK